MASVFDGSDRSPHPVLLAFWWGVHGSARLGPDSVRKEVSERKSFSTPQKLRSKKFRNSVLRKVLLYPSYTHINLSVRPPSPPPPD